MPAGVGRYAGLLSVDLPPGIQRGDIYNISIQQFEEAVAQQVTPPPPPQITTRRNAPNVPAAPSVPTTFSWHQLMGAFQCTIVISTKDQLFYPEERLLAWLKWRLQVAPPTSRWRRSSRAAVILASPKTLGHSPKARLVVTITEVRS